MINLNVNRKLKPLLLKPKPLKIVYGGRSSGKSTAFGDIFTIKMLTESADIYCLREFQDSIKDSVHRVFKNSITKRLGLDGWTIQENTIISPNGAQTLYKGASRNPSSIQSAEGYLYSWFEEAQKASEVSLDLLIPTILRQMGSECWFSGNPGSSEDPFSQRFIMPFYDQLQTTGYYEDEMFLIIKLNWRDNPWWNEIQEKIRQHDYETMTRAKYNWIWEGEFNDSVKDALIKAEWFDACIDAHKKLGFSPRGAKVASHDPSDEGPDNKAYAMKQGSVLLRLEERETGDINEGGHWAAGLAAQDQVDGFIWDCDGMGIGLKEQLALDLKGKPIILTMFKGSEGPDNPDNIFQPIEATNFNQFKPVLIKDAIRNKRAQYYFELRQRMYNTYCAVVNGEYKDPDTLFSLDSSIKILSKLRAEVCRMPIKPNGSGLFELYTKEEMKTKFKFPSPNLSDCCMMLMKDVSFLQRPVAVMPQPIKPMSRR